MENPPNVWEVLQEIRDSQIRTELDLKYHIKRTDTLEAYVESQETRLSKVEATKQGWVFVGKVLATTIGIIATLVGLTTAIIGVIK